VTTYAQGDEPDRLTFKDIGEPERGYVVVSRTPVAGSVLELEVTHLSTAAIDPALFQLLPRRTDSPGTCSAAIRLNHGDDLFKATLEP